MLQFTWNFAPRSRLSDSVNTFWFIALIFSVSSAVDSLLGLTWSQAILLVLGNGFLYSAQLLTRLVAGHRTTSFRGGS